MAADAKYITLSSRSGEPAALMLSYGANVSNQIVNEWRSNPSIAPKAKLPSAIVDQFSRISTLAPYLQTGLSNGNLFQVVGTPELVRGIQEGSLALMQTSTGSLGTVVSTGTGQIAGQLRFEPSSALGSVAAPAFAFTMINAIAGTYQLQQINRTLQTLERSIHRSSQRSEASVVGMMIGSIEILDEIHERASVDWTVAMHDRHRLANAELQIKACFHRYRVLIDAFSANASEALRQNAVNGASAASVLIKEEGATLLSDVDLLTNLCRAQARIDELHLLIDLADNSERVEQQIETIRRNQQLNAALLSTLPTLDPLFRHASDCVKQMNWFQRHLFDRGTAQEVKQLRKQRVEQMKSEQTASRSLTENVPSYCFWKDDEGLHVLANQPGNA